MYIVNNQNYIIIYQHLKQHFYISMLNHKILQIYDKQNKYF